MWARFPEPNLRNSTTPSRWLLILGRGDYPDPRLATASINLIQLPTRTRPNPTRRFRRSHRSRSAFRACTLPLSDGPAGDRPDHRVSELGRIRPYFMISSTAAHKLRDAMVGAVSCRPITERQ